MTEKLSKSEAMRRVRAKDTMPEIIVRKALHAAGLRFRLHRKDLPGKPDIVLPKRNVCIFVNGCFWHQHEGCAKAHRPKTNTSFWNKKLSANVVRDKQDQEKLKELGWKVIVLWECEINRGSDFIKENRGLLFCS